MLTRVRSWLLGMPPEAFSPERMGFELEPGIRERMGGVIEAFLAGYHAAIEEVSHEALTARLETVQPASVGFAYEGAGLGLTVLDLLTFHRRDRFRSFVEGPGSHHVYMMHVGAGLALGRLPISPDRLLRRLDPFYRWAVPDGFGFYEGFVRKVRRVDLQEIPKRLEGYARRTFDVGLGRSIWFSSGADPATVAATIAAFAPARQRDLWSGVGIAVSYTGWVDRETIESLRLAAGDFSHQLGQGATISAMARERAGNPTAETEAACRVLCQMPAAEAAVIAEKAMRDLATETGEDGEPAFEHWRQLTCEQFAQTPRLPDSKAGTAAEMGFSP